MSPPMLPSTLEVDFEPDGFRCALRANEALVSLPTLRWLGAGAVVTSALGMLAVGPVSPLMGVVAILTWPWVVIALLYGGGRLLNVVLAAPRVTRVRCTHEAVTLEVMVHGMLRDDMRIPLAQIETCRLNQTGIELVCRVGGRPEIVDIPATNSIAELEWVAATIAQAVERRSQFEADERSAGRSAARDAARLLVQRTGQARRDG